ncbi:UNVERIFIED_CONTAM: hypothetical protein GTU68_051869 [Idotea baltica]|nr:hypothetical protein [Idotea baltica]
MSPEVAELCDDYWNWRMVDMPQFATFVGIHNYDSLLDDMSEEAYEDRLVKCQEFLSRAVALEPSLTDEADIINIKVLEYELNTYIGSYQFKGFYLPMNYLEGPQVDMENQFGWMLRDTFDDYDVMIRRMELLPLQIDQIIDLMKAGVTNGITYNAISMKNLDSSIGRFVVSDATESPFYVYFSDGFPSNFTQEQIDYLQTKAQTVILEEVSPAYAKLLDYTLNEYVTREDIAVTSITNGVEFYENLIWFHTSTNLTAQEIQNIGFEEVNRIEAEMDAIIVEMGYEGMSTLEFSNMIRDDPANYYNTSEDVMAAFDYIVYDLVPPLLPEIFKNIPEAELEVVADPDPDAPAAFYLSGSYDGSRPGVFYVNTYDPSTQPKYSMLTLSLHEGNPGHHLQGSHSIESEDFPFFRRVMEDRNYGISPSRFPIYTYYVEGWALYAEALGFDMDLYEDLLNRYGHYSEEIFRACRLVVDTGMHALGWSRDDAVNYMLNHTASSQADLEVCFLHS